MKTELCSIKKVLIQSKKKTAPKVLQYFICRWSAKSPCRKITFSYFITAMMRSLCHLLPFSTCCFIMFSKMKRLVQKQKAGRVQAGNLFRVFLYLFPSECWSRQQAPCVNAIRRYRKQSSDRATRARNRICKHGMFLCRGVLTYCPQIVPYFGIHCPFQYLIDSFSEYSTCGLHKQEMNGDTNSI